MIDLSSVPAKPGCYVYKDKKGTIIYIGKAKILKKRVAQYFQRTHDEKTQQLVKSIHSSEYFVTRTESQALLLEANLIKKHQPKYNIDLKGGKRYAYILLTKEKYPRLLTARDQRQQGYYYGPFVRAHLRHALLHTLRKAFFVRTCRTLPKKPCLRYHIGLCKAPCVQKQSSSEYQHNIQQVKDFLEGKNKKLIKDLRKHMKVLAKDQNFEAAKENRDQIQALEYLQQRQLVEREENVYEDAINYIKHDNQVHILVFNVRNGVLGDRQEFELEYSEGFFDEFLRRYYEDQGEYIPKVILIPEKVEDSTAAYLSRLAGRKIEIRVPQKGARKDLLTLVAKNIEAITQGPNIASQELHNNLQLARTPRVIECFDISHLQGSSMAGSMVQFVNGKPHKNQYRRFKIRTLDQIDDFRAIKEVVYRRYKHLFEQDLPLPDLVVIDGGAEQLKFALQALEEVGVEIPIIGLAKKFEEIYLPGKRVPLRFSKKLEMMKLLIAARDEAHRFGLKYHHLLRSKHHKPG